VPPPIRHAGAAVGRPVDDRPPLLAQSTYGPRVAVPFDDDIAYRTARLSVRLSQAALVRIREAAILRQQDLTSFVLGAALDRASEIVALERGTRPPAAPGPDESEPPVVRDPDDPDDELWDDYRVAREPPVMRELVFEALKEDRRIRRERGLPIEPVDRR
jgi:hypothetical protein